MKKSVVLLLSLLLASVTIYGQTKEEKKRQKAEKAEREYQVSKDLVNSNAFTFVALQTTPLGGERFFLNTTPNYINIEGERGDIYLPYFGVVRAGNGYSPEAGIKFKGDLENYKVKFNDEKQRIHLSFEIQRGHERHEFNFTIQRGGAANLVVASSRRNSITYDGRISELERSVDETDTQK